MHSSTGRPGRAVAAVIGIDGEGRIADQPAGQPKPARRAGPGYEATGADEPPSTSADERSLSYSASGDHVDGGRPGRSR